MKQVVDYFLSQGMNRIGILTGLEETTDQEEVIEDKRLENFKNYSHNKEEFITMNWSFKDFTAQSGYDLDERGHPKLGDQLPQPFAASDSLASVPSVLSKKLEINLPDRVSLISFNDTSLTKQSILPL